MPTPCLRFLTAAQILRLYETNIIRARPTQMTYLKSAVFSPEQHRNYGQDDPFQLASILAQKIILNHPFQDGNKRTALVAASMFLQLHCYQLREKLFTSDEMDEQIKDAHVAVATRHWDAEQLTSFYKTITTSL
ncbi:DOC family protein [Fusarium mundagurra]|uniref:DOC family protein n=1 Tax=Fusarium mundagurra TaxID=1567541 RepID=A0A8H5YNN2_9HYPO|nr:DOC family protein [Fusarium mundagurra]